MMLKNNTIIIIKKFSNNEIIIIIPNSRPKWTKFTPVFRTKRPKHRTQPDGAAHTHIAYIREYPPGKLCVKQMVGHRSN